jgi:hypothetical protein
MRPLLLAALAVAALAGPARAAEPGADAANGYAIETDGSTTALARGERGKLVYVLRGKNGWHVDPRTPLKIELSAPEGLRLEKTRLTKADAIPPKSESPRFEAPFSAVAPGRHEATARLDFFVCSADACVKQVRTVTIPVAVK